jgi:hypothetical protein
VIKVSSVFGVDKVEVYYRREEGKKAGEDYYEFEVPKLCVSYEVHKKGTPPDIIGHMICNGLDWDAYLLYKKVSLGDESPVKIVTPSADIPVPGPRPPEKIIELKRIDTEYLVFSSFDTRDNRYNDSGFIPGGKRKPSPFDEGYLGGSAAWYLPGSDYCMQYCDDGMCEKMHVWSYLYDFDIVPPLPLRIRLPDYSEAAINTPHYFWSIDWYYYEKVTVYECYRDPILFHTTYTYSTGDRQEHYPEDRTQRRWENSGYAQDYYMYYMDGGDRVHIGPERSCTISTEVYEELVWTGNAGVNQIINYSTHTRQRVGEAVTRIASGMTVGVHGYEDYKTWGLLYYISDVNYTQTWRCSPCVSCVGGQTCSAPGVPSLPVVVYFEADDGFKVEIGQSSFYEDYPVPFTGVVRIYNYGGKPVYLYYCSFNREKKAVYGLYFNGTHTQSQWYDTEDLPKTHVLKKGDTYYEFCYGRMRAMVMTVKTRYLPYEVTEPWRP